ncbi:pitrilysin family protein [Sphingosinicella sp. LY1275]|uniref:M16 family metallopeptidase n=1 Tax=Sphingosinicella sp. LY1275 TaxID=3095379 RepID=UPI002ADECB1F|nr:pitrilysin family protein [Sphingosinicella sp. LY1275]MEA1013721.1 pitrilysin family protein [Sphingosinicella sp. LY1275]
MKHAVLAFAAMLAAAPAPAQDSFPSAPPIADPKPFKLPATESYTLPNGLNVTLIPYGIAPKTVVSLRIRAGNATEGVDTWLADLTGAMMKEGAGGRTAAQVAATAAGMGGQLDVSVTQQSMQVTTNVLSEHAPAAVALVSDVAMRPDLPASEIARVKANLGRQLSVSLSQPGTLADVALARRIYGLDHPYGRTVPTQAQLAAYTIEQVKAFHAGQLGARRAHLYIAGRFDAPAVKAAVAKELGSWAPGPEPLKIDSPHSTGPQLLLVDRPGAPQTTLRLAFDAAQAGNDADIPQRVTNSLLGGAFSSRITTNIRENKGYTYSPRSRIGFQPDDALWTFEADVTTEHTGDALREVFKEIRRMQTEVAPDEESKGIRTYMAGLFAIQNSTTAAVVNTLATRDLLGLPSDWTERYIPAVLAVSPEQMMASANASYPLDKLTLVIVGDLKSVVPQLKAQRELASVPMITVTVP